MKSQLPLVDTREPTLNGHTVRDSIVRRLMNSSHVFKVYGQRHLALFDIGKKTARAWEPSLSDIFRSVHLQFSRISAELFREGWEFLETVWNAGVFSSSRFKKGSRSLLL
jgi:hypothetical protein